MSVYVVIITALVSAHLIETKEYVYEAKRMVAHEGQGTSAPDDFSDAAEIRHLDRKNATDVASIFQDQSRKADLINTMRKADYEEQYKIPNSVENDVQLQIGSKKEPLTKNKRKGDPDGDDDPDDDDDDDGDDDDDDDDDSGSKVTVASAENVMNVRNATLANNMDNHIRMDSKRTVDRHGNSTADGPNVAEYYGNLVSCAGKTFLLTRLEVASRTVAKLKGWQTRVRELKDLSSNAADLPSAILSFNHLSHNVAGVCWNNTVVLVGGQFRRDRKEPHFQGVYISRTNPTSLDAFAQISRPQVIFRGDHDGCVERRYGFSACEFDGRFSLIHFRDRFLLFARANLPSRSVQMTTSKNLQQWSRFELIHIEGVNRQASQIYFLTATVIKKDELIAGHFPGDLAFSADSKARSSGVHATLSKDGLHWDWPMNVLPTSGFKQLLLVDEIPRYQWNGFQIHPVGLFNNRLMTQEPKDVRSAFRISQEFNDTKNMKERLQLTELGIKKALHIDEKKDMHKRGLLEAPASQGIVYDMEIWNE